MMLKRLKDAWDAFRESDFYKIYVKPPSQPPTVEETFQAQAREEGRWICISVWGITLGMIALLLPPYLVDQYLQGELTFDVMVKIDAVVVIISAVSLYGLLKWDFFKQQPFRVNTIGYLLAMEVAIYYISQVGGPETYSYTWLLWTPFLTAGAFSWRIVERNFWVLGGFFLVAVTYFGLHPEYLDYPYLTELLVIHGICCSIAIIMGHFIHSLYRTSYFRGHELEQERKELAERQDQLEKQHKQLQTERERSERLLLNVLPEEVADQLKEDENERVAEGYTDATVLFADLVGFTPLADKLPPDAVVRMLDDIFSGFDRCLQDHEVEKIKTIGDKYFAVAGLPEVREDHAEQAALLALDLQETMQDFKRDDGEAFELRIGLHTGSLVAGVIGEEKFSYDVWGDTVNIASRVEEEGVPGRIQITTTTKTMLEMNSDLDFQIERRGEVELEGKGETETYFLESVDGEGE